MTSVCIATNPRGAVMIVFQDEEKAIEELRGLGFHPIRNNGHGKNFYDNSDNFICQLRTHEVHCRQGYDDGYPDNSSG